MSDSLSKYYTMDATQEVKVDYKKEATDAIASNDFKEAFPELEKEFKKIQNEQYNLFSKKMMDYGLGNVTLGGDLALSEDKKYAIQGIQIRLNDKINRLKNLLRNGKNYVEGETIEDTFIDIANYGIIGMLIGKDKWK
mgnify:CR=1 FL=1|jgi:hypothetical protein